MGSRVVAKTQDLLWKEGEGYVHTQRRRGLKMEGAPQRDRWGRAVLPSLLGWCVLTGAERKTPDGLVRELSEAVKPKLYAYHGYADAYPRVPT